MLGYLNLTDDDYIDDFDLKAEEIPGEFILQREIRNASKGKDFFINSDQTGEAIYFDGVPLDHFFYYYKIWENFHYFGLPYGKGWANEKAWLLEFLKAFTKAKESVDVFIENKMSKKGNMT